MWLLSTDRAALHYFPRNFDAIGGYAVLSHTWIGNEQTLQEVRAIGQRCRASGTNPRDDPALSQKIRNCCILSEKHGYRWVWIDSCCIDKTSSSELSEAINSMFRWYKEAEVCFAYLADVPSDDNLDAPESAFRKSRWHTRGWTLQELIAPDFLIFLSDKWNELGNRAELATLLEEITRVPSEVSTGDVAPAQWSVSIRMSWASSCKTTRVEDEAYCLMGLFGVSMPTNYGEGKKAFIRLQYEIMQHNPDMSLFAFGYCVQQDHPLTFHPQERVAGSWQFLMTDSPRELMSGFEYIPDLGTDTEQQYPPPLHSSSPGPFGGGVELPRATVTSYGVELQLPIYESDGLTIAVILCQLHGRYIGLFLTRDSHGMDPKRPRYFTSCVYTKAATGFARFNARMADLGADLYNLTFNGKAVKASWRTIYVVPNPSDLDSRSSTTPNLSINCQYNPLSRFRVPRWLIARFTALQFEVDEVINTEALRVLELFLHGAARIYVSLGSCSLRDSNQLPRLWAKVDMLLDHEQLTTFDHDCEKDHISSESWSMRSKVFGDEHRAVRLSLIPSMQMPDAVLSIHLEPYGRVLGEILREGGYPTLFPSVNDLQVVTPRSVASRGPKTASGPISLGARFSQLKLHISDIVEQMPRPRFSKHKVFPTYAQEASQSNVSLADPNILRRVQTEQG